MAEVAKKCTKKPLSTDIKLTSGNTDYIRQNLEMMAFIKSSKCKTKAVQRGQK